MRRELVTRFVQASAIADDLGANIVRNRVLTTKGKTRAAVTTYLQVLDPLHKLAGSIGLERQPKQLESIETWARGSRS